MGVVTRNSSKNQIPRYFYDGNQGDTYRETHQGETEGAGTDNSMAGRTNPLLPEPSLQGVRQTRHKHRFAQTYLPDFGLQLF